jgi:hypothetical protein
VGAVPVGPGTGDERQVGEAVSRGLGPGACDRADVDLRQEGRIGRLGERLGLRVRDGKADVESAAGVMDDDEGRLTADGRSDRTRLGPDEHGQLLLAAGAQPDQVLQSGVAEDGP